MHIYIFTNAYVYIYVLTRIHCITHIPTGKNHENAKGAPKDSAERGTQGGKASWYLCVRTSREKQSVRCVMTQLCV